MDAAGEGKKKAFIRGRRSEISSGLAPLESVFFAPPIPAINFNLQASNGWRVRPVNGFSLPSAEMMAGEEAPEGDAVGGRGKAFLSFNNHHPCLPTLAADGWNKAEKRPQ